MRQRVRIVTFAWGDRYIGDLLNATLPALLAPGNLPCLADRFDCDVVFLSQEHKFPEIAAHPAYARLAGLCPTRLVPLDDLIVGPWYGMSLTFALHRGIADLGPAMTDTFCLFFNADFILADGALRSLAGHIEAGERLIVAPGYCAITEEVAPILRERRDDARMTLSIPPRELAALALRHRHFTVRAKTVNQQMLRTEHYDQFYWYVDDDTLLARHMPIAVMCMRPLVHLAQMHTFWDYGLVSEACRGVTPCVLADSDDFMMLELRDAKTYTDLVSLGWPTLQEIVDDLSSFTTQDHRDYGRYTLILHAGPLPAGFDGAVARFDGFMADLYARLGPPVGYANHQYWAGAIDEFKRLQDAYHSARARGPITAPVRVVPERAPPPGALTRLRGHAQGIYARLVGSLPRITRNHPYWADLNRAVALVDETLARPGTRVLIVTSQFNAFAKLVDGERVQVEQTGRRDELFGAPAARAETAPFDLCVCDLSYEEFAHFREIYETLRPRLRTGATVLTLYLNRTYRWLDAKDGVVIRNAFPLSDVSRLRFQGSGWVRLARRLFDRGVLLTGALGLAGRLAAPVLLAASCLVAALINRLGGAGDGLRFRAGASSLALELTVTRATDAGFLDSPTGAAHDRAAASMGD